MSLTLGAQNPDSESASGFDMDSADGSGSESAEVAAPQKHPAAALGLTLSVNAVMNVFDRIFLDDPCYKSDWTHIKHNFASDWVWDNDSFLLNQIGHPCQGAMYFNAVRANGYGYWASGLGTVLGSVTWEYFCETDPPSMNDLLSTTAGGMAIGEVSWRLYRLIRGDKVPVKIAAGLGAQVLADPSTDWASASAGVAAWMDLEYGSPFKGGNEPYDWFRLALKAGSISAPQQMSIVGRLYGKNWQTERGNEVMVGLFQHFNYFDVGGLEVSETHSFGPGIVAQVHDRTRLEAHLGGIVMGGVVSDHYKVLLRDYNMGSGYSLTGRVSHEWKAASASLDARHFQVFTPREYDHSYDGDPLLLDAQGAKSSAVVDMLQMSLDVRCSDHISLRFEPAYYARHTHYTYHDDVTRRLVELTAGVEVCF